MASIAQLSPTILFLNPNPNPKSPCSVHLPLKTLTPKRTRLTLHASATPSLSPSPPPTLLSTSTRTVASLLATALALFRSISAKLCRAPTPDELAKIASLRSNLCCAVGPLFFASISSSRGRNIRTPLTVVAAGMERWLDIYSGVLFMRVLLSWFPNIPWERQPLSAMRDLCDPYLNLFRNIIPPVFDTLDVSPLLAFALLGLLGSIMSSAK